MTDEQVKIVNFDGIPPARPITRGQDESTPRAIDFGSIPAQSVKQEKTIDKSTGTPTMIDFGSMPSVATDKSKKAPEVLSAFDNEASSPLGKRALDIAKKRFASLMADESAVRRFASRINSLCPLSVSKTASWFDKELEANAGLTTDIAQLTRRFAAMSAADVLAEAVRSANEPRPSSFLSSLVRHRGPTPDEAQARIHLIKQQLLAILTECDGHLPEAEKMQSTLSTGLAVVSSVHEASGEIADRSLESALIGRREILSAGLAQAKMLPSQLHTLRAECVRLLRDADQILNVTIPGWRMVFSHDKH